MGGALALGALLQCPAEITAALPFYGFNPQLGDPAALPAGRAVQGHFGAEDGMKGFSDPEAARALAAGLARSAAAGDCEVIVHERVGHAFMNATPEGIARRAKLGQGAHHSDVVAAAWEQAFAFLAKHLR
jgi:carboxymethylenebutenolidase